MKNENGNEERKKEEVVEETTQVTEEVKDNSEYEELNDRYKRLLAEFENYKKRSQKEKDGIYGMITGDVVATMLPIMDNLEKGKNKQSSCKGRK